MRIFDKETVAKTSEIFPEQGGEFLSSLIVYGTGAFSVSAKVSIGKYEDEAFASVGFIDSVTGTIVTNITKSGYYVAISTDGANFAKVTIDSISGGYVTVDGGLA